jgi:cell division FtsZ-interacting protein ZapD
MSVIEFPAKPRPRTFLGDEEDEAPYEYRGRPYTRRGPNMQTFVFRSYDLIANSDEADLVRHVGLDLDKAQTKLRRLKEALQNYQERTTAHIQMLTAAETKLTAAIVAALLSGQS